MQPAVGDDGDVVVRRDRLEHGNRERHVVLFLSVPLPENEGVVEEYDLAIDVLDKDPERLGPTVDLLNPPEIGDDSKVDAEQRASDGLNLGLQPIESLSTLHSLLVLMVKPLTEA